LGKEKHVQLAYGPEEQTPEPGPVRFGLHELILPRLANIHRTISLYVVSAPAGLSELLLLPVPSMKACQVQRQHRSRTPMFNNVCSSDNSAKLDEQSGSSALRAGISQCGPRLGATVPGLGHACICWACGLEKKSRGYGCVMAEAKRWCYYTGTFFLAAGLSLFTVAVLACFIFLGFHA
jgi:hypothetical protein